MAEGHMAPGFPVLFMVFTEHLLCDRQWQVEVKGAGETGVRDNATGTGAQEKEGGRFWMTELGSVCEGGRILALFKGGKDVQSSGRKLKVQPSTWAKVQAK